MLIGCSIFVLEAVSSMLLSLCSHVPVFCYYPGSDPSVNFAAFRSALITLRVENKMMPHSQAPLVEVKRCAPACQRSLVALTTLLYPSEASVLQRQEKTKTQTRVYLYVWQKGEGEGYNCRWYSICNKTSVLETKGTFNCSEVSLLSWRNNQDFLNS